MTRDIGTPADVLLNCALCRTDVVVPATSIMLHLSLAPGRIHGSYRYSCPACGAAPVAPVGDRNAGLLLRSGAETTVGPTEPWRQPPPPVDDVDLPELPPDELIGLRRDLDGPRWRERLDRPDG